MTPTVNHVDAVLLERHKAWWQGRGTLHAEVYHEPLGDLWLPMADGSVAREDLAVWPGMLDADRMAGPPVGDGPIETDGDLLRVVQPFPRVPWVEAILGTPVRATIAGGSMRTEAFVRTWDDWSERAGGQGDGWLHLLLELTSKLVERSPGRRAVVPTLMRGPCDLAEAVLGPHLMCFSMYDHPGELRAFLANATTAFIDTLRAQLDLIPQIAGGHVNPFGIWAPGTVVRTQCDASAFLSPTHYADWYLPWDERICRAFDYSIIHLHSVSLHTVVPLLRVERPQAIQVTVETTPGAPSIPQMLPVFRRILERKPLIVDGQLSEEDLTTIWRQLPNDGLCVIVRKNGW